MRYTVEFPKTGAKGLGLRFYGDNEGSSSKSLVVKTVMPNRLASSLSPRILPSSVVVEVDGIAVSGKEQAFKAVVAMSKALPGTITFISPDMSSEDSDDEEGEDEIDLKKETASVALLHQILSTPSRAEELLAYFEQTMEDSELRFIVAVSELHRDCKLEYFDGKARMSAVYAEFVVEDAASEIQLPAGIRSGIKRCFRGLYPKGRTVRGQKELKYNVSVFDKAQKYVANEFAARRLGLFLEQKHAKSLQVFVPKKVDQRVEARAARAIQGLWRKRLSRRRVMKKVENLASKARLNPGAVTVAERRYLAKHHAEDERRAMEYLRPSGMQKEAWKAFRQAIKVLYT